jgi:hypothetical protein
MLWVMRPNGTITHDRGEETMELEQFFKDFQDHLAPRLGTYEQAICLCLFCRTRLIGSEEAVVGFKSARRRLACGIGETGKPMSESTAGEELQSLQKNGFARSVGRASSMLLPFRIANCILNAFGMANSSPRA